MISSPLRALTANMSQVLEPEITTRTTLLPFTMAGSRLGVRLDPPRLGEHTRALLSALGLASGDIDALYEQRAVA